MAAVLAIALLTSCGKTEEKNAADTKQEESVSTEAVADTKDSKDSKDTVEKNPNLARPSTNGSLAVEGTKLVDQDGDVVQLRGVSTHGLAWFPQYVNDECFSDLSSWGANVVRLALYTHESGGYCTDGNQEELRKLVADGVTYAIANDLYVIIDWHVLNEGNPNTYISEASAFFAEISKEYADCPNVIYEICNEPCNGTSWSEIKSYANTIIPLIRANDADAVILVGTPNWSQYVDEAAADPLSGYDNIMYTLHFYAATHKDDLRARLQTAHEAGLPIFVSEFGICDASGNGSIDTDSANAWIELLDADDISYVCWNLSNKNESSAILSSSCAKTNGFMTEDLSEEGKWLVDVLDGRK